MFVINLVKGIRKPQVLIQYPIIICNNKYKRAISVSMLIKFEFCSYLPVTGELRQRSESNDPDQSDKRSFTMKMKSI